jgi:hypothetical protein
MIILKSFKYLFLFSNFLFKFKITEIV